MTEYKTGLYENFYGNTMEVHNNGDGTYSCYDIDMGEDVSSVIMDMGITWIRELE